LALLGSLLLIEHYWG